jgi:DNA-binding transcriptional regulator YdaS (Cro superfamily)
VARKLSGIAAFKVWVRDVGGSVAASAVLPIGDSMVRHICGGSRPLTAEIAYEVDKASNGAVTREMLIPKLFGPIKYRRVTNGESARST